MLDGFDEMVSSVDESVVVDAFAQLLVLAALKVKTLITCRSNMFASSKSLLDLLQRFAIETPSSPLADALSVRLERAGRVIELCPWDRTRVVSYVEGVAGDEAGRILEAIRTVHDLTDLSSRPVLLDMLVRTIPKLLKSKLTINSAALYEIYTEQWTSRDDWRANTPLGVRRNLCEALAIALHQSGGSTLEYAQLALFVDNARIQIGTSVTTSEFEADVRVCSFLVRADETGFRFAHRSFLEYFVSQYLVNLLLSIKDEDQAAVSSRNTPPPSELQAFLSARDPLGRPSDSHLLTMGLFDWTEGVGVSGWLRQRRETIDLRATILAQVKGAYPDMDAETPLEHKISPEIATFILETFVLKNVSAIALLKDIEGTDREVLFGEILRQASPSGLSDEFRATLRHHLTEHPDTRLSLGILVGLGKLPNGLDAAALLDLRSRIRPEQWHYCLFELADSGGDSDMLAEVLKNVDQATLLERTIVLWAQRGTTPNEVTLVQVRDLANEITESDNTAGAGSRYGAAGGPRVLIIGGSGAILPSTPGVGCFIFTSVKCCRVARWLSRDQCPQPHKRVVDARA